MIADERKCESVVRDAEMQERLIRAGFEKAQVNQLLKGEKGAANPGGDGYFGILGKHIRLI